MKDLQYYLEMLSTNEFRNKMNAAGLQANQGIAVESKLPIWLFDDIEWLHGKNIDLIKKSSNQRKALIEALSKFVFETPIPKNKKEIRIVITSDGKILWGNESKIVHTALVAYGMCKGYIPIDKKLSNFGWGDKIKYSVEHFICLEKLRDGGLMFSRSYTTDPIKVFNKVALSNGRYMEALKTLNVKIEDIY